MQFIGNVTTVYFEWMPEGTVREIFDEYGHAHELNEGANFSIEQVMDWAIEEGYIDYQDDLYDFMREHRISNQAEVKWSW